MKIASNKNQRPYKAAIYMRFANANQLSDDLVDVQRHSLRAFAENEGLEIYREYVDEGYKGNTLNRPAFAQMQADIKAGEIDTVIVRNISRIARDCSLYNGWASKMDNIGVKICAADNSHDYNSSMQDFLSGLMKPTDRVKRRKKPKRR